MEHLIEAGHFYEVNGPTKASVVGWKIGQILTNTINDARLALFIDDYHTEQNFLEKGDYTLNASKNIGKTMKNEADVIFYENDFYKKSKQRIIQLLDNSQVKLKRGQVSKSGIRLATINNKDLSLDKATFTPTCTLLDFMLLEEKSKIAPHQTIVLPETYRHQQEGLKKILGSIAIDNLVSYSNHYFNLEGNN